MFHPPLPPANGAHAGPALDLSHHATTDLRKSRGSPRSLKRSLASSWDDIMSSRKMLRASLNTEDLSLLLDSIECPRNSPATARAFVPVPSPSASRFVNNQPAFSPSMNRLFPLSPSASRFLLPSPSVPRASPAIHRRISSSLSNFPALPPLPESALDLSVSTSTTPLPPAAPAAGSAPAPLSAPPIVITPPSFGVPKEHSRSLDMTTIEQQGQVVEPQLRASGRLEQEYLTLTAPLHSSYSQDQFAANRGRISWPYPSGTYEMDPAAAQAHSLQMSQGGIPPPMQGSYVGVHITAEGETFNYNYAMQGTQKSSEMPLDHSHPPGTWSCLKCSKADFRVTSNPNFVPDAKSDEGSEDSKGQRKGGAAKTYKCTVSECNKSFITRKEQLNHIARHSSEPRYFCTATGCSCKYTTKSSLDLHVTRTHAEKKYKCDMCDERYAVRGDLNQHMKRKHKHNSKHRKSA